MKKQIELTYSFDALEPYIDALTMETHYSKHHKAYTDNLNAAIDATPEIQGKCVKTLLRNINEVPESVRTTVINNGGGFVNHNLYFDILSATPQEKPTGDLLENIQQHFGSVESLQEQLTTAALKQFGSGWAWLAVKDGTKELAVLTTANQDTVLPLGYTPILGIDVWEHAYYLHYKNLRKAYVDNFFKVLDWSKVEKYYDKAVNNTPCCH